MATHASAAHAWSCLVPQGDIPAPSTVPPGCDLVFLSQYGAYPIEELVMEATIDGVWTSIPFEGERSTTTVTTRYGMCDMTTCTYEEWQTMEDFRRYVLSPVASLPEGTQVSVSLDQADGAQVRPLVSFTIGNETTTCYDDGYTVSGSCVLGQCGDPLYTMSSCGSGDRNAGGGGCSASSKPGDWPFGAGLALLMLAAGWSWRPRLHRRA